MKKEMSMELFKEELQLIINRHMLQLFEDVLEEVEELYEGVTGVKNMVIKGVEQRAEIAERTVEEMKTDNKLHLKK